MTRRPPRKWELVAREKAFQAARLARDEGTSLEDASARVGGKVHSTGLALFILTNGTEQEIAQAMTYEVALNVVTDAIRARLPKAERTRKSPVTGLVMAHAEASDSAIYARLRDVLDGISEMPQPSDVVAIVRKHRMRGDVLNKRLIHAYTWMMEFSDAWTK